MLQNVETSRRRVQADALRKLGVKAPIASVSHWRREKEFSEAVGADGFDLVDDRIYWSGPTLQNPNYRSMLWSRDGGLLAESSAKRRVDKPYIVGQWCDMNPGIWASPFEAAEQLLAVQTGATHDWDGLVRRGLFPHPDHWAAAAPGTGGVEDIYQIPEVANAEPHVFALWPHEASLLLRGGDSVKERAEALHRGTNSRSKRQAVPGWQPERGRLVLETPYTQGVAGWPGGIAVRNDDMPLEFELESTYGVLVASSVGPETIAKTKRLLVTAISRVSPTGFTYVDPWKREAADPGRPPLLAEPVIAKVLWKRKGQFKAYALDNNGARIGPAKVEKDIKGWRLVIQGTVPALHWELVAE